MAKKDKIDEASNPEALHAEWLQKIAGSGTTHALARPWADLSEQDQLNFEHEHLAGTLPLPEAPTEEAATDKVEG